MPNVRDPACNPTHFKSLYHLSCYLNVGRTKHDKFQKRESLQVGAHIPFPELKSGSFLGEILSLSLFFLLSPTNTFRTMVTYDHDAPSSPHQKDPFAFFASSVFPSFFNQ